MALADRYQWLFRKIPVLTVSLDQDGFFLDASDAWLLRFGYERDGLSRLRPQDLASPQCARRIEEDYLPLLRRTGRLGNVPVDLMTAAGEQVQCLSSAIVELGDKGDYLRTVVAYTEVAEQARIESHYRDLYRATPAMLYTVDAQGHLLHVSERWLRKMGYAREQVLGRLVTDFMASESREQLTGDVLRQSIARGELDNEPRRFITRSGDVIEAVVSAFADRNSDGQVERMLVAVKDVTERNEAERQLRAAAEENARLREELQLERDYLREEVQLSMNYGRIIGDSAALKRMLVRLEAVAETSANVLIAGESGVGKELVAHALHSHSPRCDGPLVKVNCASIPRELFESEFFGHVKGAFTGAHRDRVGRFQLADTGTLFLDEISEIPLELQGKLLRVLQEKEFEPVGDDQTRTVDVRLIAATNQDLEQAVEQGKFREDLYYRLSVFPIAVPALRDRGDDVVQLARHFLDRACKDFGHKPLLLSKQQAALLKAYDWPGNVRELKNVIERAVILSGGKVLRLDLAMADLLRVVAEPVEDDGISSARIYREAEIVDLQKENVRRALEAANWRVSGADGAANLLGLKPTTLTDRIKKCQRSRPARSRGS